MQHLISWKQYWLTSSFCFFIYYLFIALWFYRSELLRLRLVRRFMMLDDDAVEIMAPNLAENPQEKKIIQNPLTAEAEELKGELVALLTQSVAQKKVQDDIVESLKKLVAKYPELKGSSFQQVLITAMTNETEKLCKFHLTEEEMVSVWK